MRLKMQEKDNTAALEKDISRKDRKQLREVFTGLRRIRLKHKDRSRRPARAA